MPPRTTSPRPEVGVRELHNQLSRYIRHAAEGGEVIVTLRGRPVARLAPMEAPPEPCESGLVEEPRPRTLEWRRIRLQGPGPLASDYVLDQRR